MRKVYYVYNTRTACYDRVYPTFRQRLSSYLRHAFIFGLVCALSVFLFLFWWVGPSQTVSVADNKRLKTQYAVVNDQLDEALDVLDKIKERDENLYRVMVQADPVADEAGNATFNHSIDVSAFDHLSDASLLNETMQKMQRLRQQLYNQSLSFDKVSDSFKSKDDKLKCIPSIQPIRNADLAHLSSGFGLRIDPIFGTLKMHNGLDFSAPQGSQIFATGAGVVSFAGWNEGYGYCTILDHGYGYQTLYAHQMQILVRAGQSVNRGEVIGYVGNTGKSTGPHLHYEVMIRGRKVNPVNFFSKELTPQQYDELLRMAASHAGVFD